MSLALDSIERKVKAALCKLDERRGPWGNAKCTSEVKNAIGSVGEELGFKPYAASCRWDNCEWLFDLCWCEEDERGLVKDMPLAAECEWGIAQAALLDDFQKLLVSRATHRVFLCCQETSEDWIDCVDRLIGQVRCYRGSQDGDRYLFGNWMTKGGWRFDQYVHPTQRTATTRAWMFQAVSGDYDLSKELRRGRRDSWLANRYHDRMRPGNVAVLWQAGSKAGIYGLGELTSEPRNEDGERRVWMRYTKRLDPPILKPDLRAHKHLRNMEIMRHSRGTNFRVSDEEWQALGLLVGVLGHRTDCRT